MKVKIWATLEKIVRNFTPELKLEPKLLPYLLQKKAIESSVDYIYQHMKSAQFFEKREDLYRYIFERRFEDGLVVELGVHNGHSINYLAKLVDGEVHGFDSFEGLPDDGIIPAFKSTGTKWFTGKMSEDGRLPDVAENVVLHKGWFDETLPDFFRAIETPVSVLHVDCDIYSSTVTALDCSSAHLKVGSFIIFDEYLNYFGWEANEHLAWQQFVASHGMEYKYVGVVNTGAVAVEVSKIC